MTLTELYTREAELEHVISHTYGIAEITSLIDKLADVRLAIHETECELLD